MKILYIGYYKEQSDWGKIATNNILALQSADIDVACRSIVFSYNQAPNRLTTLENKSIDDCDICIQHIFPEHMVSSGKFRKTIGILANEFVEIGHSSWIEKLDRMDQIWVPSDVAKQALLGTCIYDKTMVVPFAFDNNTYKMQHPQTQGDIEADGKFKFYTISELENPNLDRILRCFYSEFSHNDNAALLIQLNTTNPTALDERITSIKTNLGLEKEPSLYKKVIIVNKLSDQPCDQIHAFCDCYLSSLAQRSLYTEEYNAMGFGNTPIVSKNTDSIYYFGSKYAVDSMYKVNTSHSKMWPDANNGKDYTIIPCDRQIKSMMRKLYNEWNENPVMYKINKRKEALEIIEAFSIKSVGQTMKEILYA